MAAFESYDRTTGQVFHQWDAPVPQFMPQPWNRIQNRSRLSKPISLLNRGHGPAPLVDICLRVVAQNVEKLEQEHLQDLPSRLIGRLCEHVTAIGALSVEAWKLLVLRVAQNGQAAHYISPLLLRHSAWVRKTQPLAAYTEALTSASFDFLTHLTITGMVRCDGPELLRLIQLRNLAVLEIIQPPIDEGATQTLPRLTDSIVREWSITPDPFPLLRVLRVWGDDHTTFHSLRYVTAFPSLVLYDVAGRKRDWTEKGREWVWKSRSGTWIPDWADTLSKHFRLLQQGIPEDRAGSECHTGINTAIRFLHAVRDGNIQLATFQRDDYEAYKKVCRATEANGLRLPTETLGMPCMCFPYPEPSNWQGRESLWGFLMYCHIGTLSSDQDLIAQGLKIGKRAYSLKSIVLPPRPMLNIVLGEDPSTSRGPVGRNRYEPNAYRDMPIHKGIFETQITFVRDGYPWGKREDSKSMTVGDEKTKRPLDAKGTSTRPRKKRQDVSNILDTFISG
ncbi:hypothetical protein F4777DRAFT_181238 [Nemania sp. FL0916]|nr:hypothetical protein F4777DRAFT_181238 [Nemania sp. FL0916]